MKYGYDRSGKKVHFEQGMRTNTYTCPYCFEKLDLRVDCFSHQRKINRTPQERTCPEYHSVKGYDKIETELEKAYINNGGVPIYITKEKVGFSIRAIFPKLNENTEKILIEKNVKIKINNGSDVQERYIETHRIQNLSFYEVKTMQEWINVEIHPEMKDCPKELASKWLWGIRGLSAEKDVFHSYKHGGYRVARGGSLVIGKEYIILSESKMSCKDYLDVEYEGKKEMIMEPRKGSKRKHYFIYSIKILKNTIKSREFCKLRGCNLAERTSEVIPLWPPGIIEGKDYITDGSQAYYVIKKEQLDKGTVGCHSKENEIYDDVSKLVKFDIRDEFIGIKKIVKEDEHHIKSIEININQVYRKNITKKPALNQNIKTYDWNDFEQGIDKIRKPLGFREDEIYIKSVANIPFRVFMYEDAKIVLVKTENKEYRFSFDKYKNDILIDSASYGKIYIPKQVQENNINWKKLSKEIMGHTGYGVGIDKSTLEFIYMIKKSIDRDNIALYRHLLESKKSGKISTRSRHIIKKIMMRGNYYD